LDEIDGEIYSKKMDSTRKLKTLKVILSNINEDITGRDNHQNNKQNHNPLFFTSQGLPYMYLSNTKRILASIR